MDNPVTFSDITLLNTLATCANMTTDEVFKDFKIMANKKILENHKYEIYYSESEKSWRTYLPDETKSIKRRPVKRKSKENLEKEIIRFYIEKQKAENRQNVTLEELYAEWLLYKRDYTSVKAKTIQEYVSEWNRFFKDTELVKSIGFTGKTCIHPSHIEVINEVFSPTAEEIENANGILAAFEEAINDGKGACMYKNKMVDAPVAERAERIIKKAKRIQTQGIERGL